VQSQWKDISFIGNTDTYIEPLTMATAVAISAATAAMMDSGQAGDVVGQEVGMGIAVTGKIH
jgi:hypothetical protein